MTNITWQYLVWNSIIFTGYYTSLLLSTLISNFLNFHPYHLHRWNSLTGTIVPVGTIPAAVLILKYACPFIIQQRVLLLFQFYFIYKNWHMLLQYLRVLYTWKKGTTFYLKKHMYGFKFQGFHFYCLLVLGVFCMSKNWVLIKGGVRGENEGEQKTWLKLLLHLVICHCLEYYLTIHCF